MVDACIKYLEQKLKAAMGQNTPFFHRLADLRACAEQHVASAIVDKDVLTYCGDRSRNLETGLDDTMLYARTLTLQTVMGEYKLETLSPMFERFLASLGRGFRYAGHYISLELGEADWVDEKDSLIRASIAVQLPVAFRGGIYVPIQYGQIEQISIEREENHVG